MGNTQAPGSNTTHKQNIGKVLRVRGACARAKHAGSRDRTRELSQVRYTSVADKVPGRVETLPIIDEVPICC